MQFLVFFLVIFAAGIFHRNEHRRVENDLKAMVMGADPRVRGWNAVTSGDRTVLKRAFTPKTYEEKLGYAMPVVFIAVAVIMIQAWVLAVLYGIGVAVSWFLCDTVLIRKNGGAAYEVLLFGKKLFGGDIKT